ncbi:DUF3987 domain-containing protein [Vreelandella andesensis]|uniref:DUF3987 domain-containing protein n=1 Tax=Vreelandella andesensis TaxID=447567 RepID=A0A433KJ52_9GAMM|nr:DUF3987 domain-containing protein [Halomonas andesensis]RUR29728.1 DUF3987 domain-containing protein [Halomonas andesensis]
MQYSNIKSQNLMVGSDYPLPSDLRPPALPHPRNTWELTGSNKGLFANIIQAVTEENLVPPLLCVQAALAVGALVLQNQFTVERPNDGKALPLSQLVIGIAESGERKSKIMDDFMAPVTAYLAAQEDKHTQAWQHYAEEQIVWEGTYKRLMSRRTNAFADRLAKGGNARMSKAANSLSLEQIEQALERLKKAKPILPKRASIGILSDATPQAIPKYIKERRISSLGIITPEGEEILTNGIKHKSSILNKGYSGEATQRFRVGEGDQSYNVPITTCIFVQPDVAVKAFGSPGAKMRGTGTLARALIAFPQTTQGNRPLQPPEGHQPVPIGTSRFAFRTLPVSLLNIKATKKRYRRWISKKLYQADHHLGEKRITLKLSREAKALWHQAFNECESNLRPGGRYAEFKDHASKLPDQWLRVAAIIHSYDQEPSDEISVNTLTSAIELVNVFSTEFQRLFPIMSEERKHHLAMQKYIGDKRQQCRYLPKKVVTSNGPIRPVSRANVVLDLMCQQQEIRLVPYPRHTQQGRPTKPIVVIDLFPLQPHSQWEFDQAVQQEYRLGQL